MRYKEIIVSYDEWDQEKDDMITHRLTVPAKNQICDCCGGDGMVDNPAFSNGITQSEREDMGEEDFQSYMEGRYDVRCEECKGMKIVEVPDVPQCTFAQKRFLVEYRRTLIAKEVFEREQAAMYRAENWMHFR